MSPDPALTDKNDADSHGEASEHEISECVDEEEGRGLQVRDMQ